VLLPSSYPPDKISKGLTHEKPEINFAVGCVPMARVMAEKTICIERWLAATDERASGRLTL
jgi:hypothetical protein